MTSIFFYLSFLGKIPTGRYNTVRISRKLFVIYLSSWSKVSSICIYCMYFFIKYVFLYIKASIDPPHTYNLIFLHLCTYQYIQYPSIFLYIYYLSISIGFWRWLGARSRGRRCGPPLLASGGRRMPRRAQRAAQSLGLLGEP